MSNNSKIKTEDNLKIIKSLYENGSSMKYIAKIFGVSYTTINNWLKEMNVNVRHKGPQSKISNENYFDNIDCEQKAYWLGFLMADGCISIYNGQYFLKLHLQYKDRNIIDSFLSDISSTNKPYTQNKNGYKSYAVSLTSKHMVESLIKLGLTERKSGNEVFPDIPEKYYRDFIRGYFDGDGCASLGKEKRYDRIGFIGPKSLLERFCEEIKLQNITIAKANCEAEMYYFNTARKENIKTFYNFIYYDNCFCLERKKKKIEQMLQLNTEITN